MWSIRGAVLVKEHSTLAVGQYGCFHRQEVVRCPMRAPTNRRNSVEARGVDCGHVTEFEERGRCVEKPTKDRRGEPIIRLTHQ